jgi:hypothetical protein
VSFFVILSSLSTKRIAILVFSQSCPCQSKMSLNLLGPFLTYVLPQMLNHAIMYDLLSMSLGRFPRPREPAIL